MIRKGRPKIVWSEKEYKTLEGLCGIQATINEIEEVLQIDHKTIDRLCKEHYRDEKGNPLNFSQVYKKYSTTGKISVRRWQMQAAEKGNVSMLIWLGKQYLGQTEKQEFTQTDTNITFEVVSPEDN